MSAPIPLADKLAVRIVGEYGCLVWTGAHNHGWPWLTVRDQGRRRKLGGRRAVYELTVGPVPDDARVYRTCKEPLCVSPEHVALRRPSKRSQPP